MTINDYDQVYKLWINTPGMGLNNTDYSRDGIKKYLKRNTDTCFILRDDLVYRNKEIRELVRKDT